MSQQPPSIVDLEPTARATEPSHAAAGAPDATLHWTFLGLSSVVVALAILFYVHGEEQVVIPLIDAPLPETCTFKQMTGMNCPGCGLTRCFVSMAHGDVRRAWHFNPVGILLFVVVVSQIPFRSLQIWRGRRGLPEIRLGRVGYSLMLVLVAALMIQWIVRTLLGMF